MIQRHITHAAGAFAPCAVCGREPRHYAAYGSASHEGALFHPRAERHQLECRCDRRTGWCATLADAVAKWNERMAALLHAERAPAAEALAGE